jgi:LL-diaminopimelate aminotransferase
MKELPLGKKIDLFPPYLFRDLDRRRQEEVKKGRDVISLAIGDPDLPTPRPITDFAAKAVKRAANHRYPYGRGSAEFRAAVAAWHKKRHGIKLDADSEVLALIGSKEGLAHLPFALIDRGDSVIVPDPGYPPYTTGVLLSEGRLERVPLFEKDGFLPDFGRISKQTLARSKMLFLNYPNNPTGASATLDFYKEAVKFCRKNELWLAQDAAYSETYFGKPCPSVLQVPGAKDVAVEFYSLSKTYCMTGWRLGWLAGNARAVQALTKIKDNMDSGQFNAVQETGTFCLQNHERLAAPVRLAFKKRMEFFTKALTAAGWQVFVPETTFFVWAKPPKGGKSMDAVYRMLAESAVLGTPGSGFGPSGEGYVRFALCAPDARIKEAARRIAKIAW